VEAEAGLECALPGRRLSVLLAENLELGPLLAVSAMNSVETRSSSHVNEKGDVPKKLLNVSSRVGRSLTRAN
jgi:hypothetical protein